MADYDNTNRGVLFANERKQDGDRKPDRTGTLNVDGVEYFIDGWLKTSANGKKFMSLSVKRKDQQPQQDKGYGGNSSHRHQRPSPAPQQRAPQPASSGFDDMDDVPF